VDGKEKSTEQGVPCLKTKGGLCDAGQLRLFIIIAPFFCRISLTVILMRKKWKKCNSLFFFPQLVGCDFQVEHREKTRLKNECFIYKENVSLLLNVLTVTTSSVVRQGRWTGRRRGVDSLVAAANRAWWFESLVSGSGGDLYVQVINGLVNHGHHARVSRIVSISGRYWLACISIVQR
jgi:hypothetical protein